MKRALAIAILCTALAASGCSRHETIPYDPPAPEPIPFPISGIEGIPQGVTFDTLKADIAGFEWEVIATLEAAYADAAATLLLPAKFPAERLCKVTRDDAGDYTGFWPAEECSDREALVAGLRDIVAYKDGERVGRIYATHGDDSYIYLHYADRPFTLSGYGMGKTPSYYYEVSFRAGWNIYINKPDDPGYRGVTLCTNPPPGPLTLRWHFE